MLLVKLYLGGVLVHFIVLSMNFSCTGKSIACVRLMSLHNDNLMCFNYESFYGKERLFFSVTDLLYYEQRNYGAGITIC